MDFPDLLEAYPALGEGLRGRLTANQPLSAVTWFRTGGPAQLMFQPADEKDLAAFLRKLPGDVPVLPVGLGSNLLIRDGGLEGVVIRLSAKGFGEIEDLGRNRLRAGAAVPDKRLAEAAARAGLGGFAFYTGIPGGLGGALRMNAGAHGTETRERVVELTALDREGNRHVLSNADVELAKGVADFLGRGLDGPGRDHESLDPASFDDVRLALGRRLAATGRHEDGCERSGREQRGQLGALFHQIDHLQDAPYLLLVCGERDWPFKVPAEERVGLAPPNYGAVYPCVQNILLACRAVGLGAALTTMHQVFEAELHQRFNIPDSHGVVVTIPIGWPIGNFGTVTRKPAEQCTFHNEWGNANELS